VNHALDAAVLSQLGSPDGQSDALSAPQPEISGGDVSNNSNQNVASFGWEDASVDRFDRFSDQTRGRWFEGGLGGQGNF